MSAEALMNDYFRHAGALTERTLHLLNMDEDRRENDRFRLMVPIPARLGQSEGTLTDLSAGGARFRHTWPVKHNAVNRLTFEWPDHNFAAVVRVLSSRLIGIGAQHPIYE